MATLYVIAVMAFCLTVLLALVDGVISVCRNPYRRMRPLALRQVSVIERRTHPLPYLGGERRARIEAAPRVAERQRA